MRFIFLFILGLLGTQSLVQAYPLLQRRSGNIIRRTSPEPSSTHLPDHESLESLRRRWEALNARSVEIRAKLKRSQQLSALTKRLNQIQDDLKNGRLLMASIRLKKIEDKHNPANKGSLSSGSRKGPYSSSGSGSSLQGGPSQPHLPNVHHSPSGPSSHAGLQGSSHPLPPQSQHLPGPSHPLSSQHSGIPGQSDLPFQSNPVPNPDPVYSYPPNELLQW